MAFILKLEKTKRQRLKKTKLKDILAWKLPDCYHISFSVISWLLSHMMTVYWLDHAPVSGYVHNLILAYNSYKIWTQIVHIVHSNGIVCGFYVREECLDVCHRLAQLSEYVMWDYCIYWTSQNRSAFNVRPVCCDWCSHVINSHVMWCSQMIVLLE